VLCLLLCGVASSESSDSSMLIDHFHTKYARRVHNHKVPDFYVKFKVGGLDGGRTGYFSIRCSALMSKLGKTSCLSWSVWGRAHSSFPNFLRAKMLIISPTRLARKQHRRREVPPAGTPGLLRPNSLLSRHPRIHRTVRHFRRPSSRGEVSRLLCACLVLADGLQTDMIIRLCKTSRWSSTI
jgi:hypothetical protein